MDGMHGNSRCVWMICMKTAGACEGFAWEQQMRVYDMHENSRCVWMVCMGTAGGCEGFAWEQQVRVDGMHENSRCVWMVGLWRNSRSVRITCEVTGTCV